MSKSIRLYYFVGDKYGRENVLKRRLKVSFSDQVNDLFELRPFDFGDDNTGRKLRQIWGNAIKKHAMSQGFISFTEHWHVPTMWAHYAENHRGICLGFDLPEAFAEEIDYVDTLEPMDVRIMNDQKYNSKMINYAKKTKSEHWRYEKEWRYWCSLTPDEKAKKSTGPNELTFVNFDENLVLREVIFGCRSELTTNALKKLLRASDDVQFQTARPSFRAFGMVAQQNPRYQK